MAGNISSLGIGSGVLTADVIDQLRAADEAAIVTPIDKSIEQNQKQKDAYTLLNSLVTSFKANASALSYDTLFDNKEVTSSGDAVVTLDAGSIAESFTLETLTLATKDITKLGALAARDTAIVASGSGVLTINNGTDSFTIDYTATMTLEELAQAITDAGGDTFSASILQTDEGAFNLIVSSKETGTDQALTLTDTGGKLSATLFAAYDETTNPTGYQKVQDASNASFKYNGILVSRSTNNFDDLIQGANISLIKAGDISNIGITMDKTPIVDEVKLFVESYNSLISNLKDMTIADLNTGTEGVFSNDSFIKSISREVTALLSTTINGQSLMGLSASSTSITGVSTSSAVFDLSSDGTLSFNSSALEKMIDTDPSGMQKLFSGETDADGVFTNGIFNTMNDKLQDYIGSNSLLSKFSDGLDNTSKKLNDSLTKAKESLDVRYATMASRFAAYDAMIARINAQFSSLQMMIDQSANG
ncbi:MAG: flagellar filament capping protein FliD [Sulfurimonas sp.]|nr:flagellar filament capping protein FliD [Sulfurimonas sp.]